MKFTGSTIARAATMFLLLLVANTSAELEREMGNKGSHHAPPVGELL